MDARQFLSPTDTRTAEGWPNPRWRMTDPAAIDARMAEDGERLAAELAGGACTRDDLTRLGWRLDQVRAAQGRQAAEAEALERAVARARETVRDILSLAPGNATGLAPAIREPLLDDMDIAFGCEEAA